MEADEMEAEGDSLREKRGKKWDTRNEDGTQAT